MFSTAKNSFGLIIVGDEVLSGRCQDVHLNQTIEILKHHRQRLAWSYCIGDDLVPLTQALKASYANAQQNNGVVFVTGGIGATPDDRTRQAAAHAFNCPLTPHPEGVNILEAKFNEPLSEHRTRLVSFPQGATLIPNPINQVPGFSLHNHFFVPGFPKMAAPMFEWVMQTHFANRPPSLAQEKGIRVFGISEGDIAPILNDLENKFADVASFSLPSTQLDEHYVDVGVKSMNQNHLNNSYDYLEHALNQLNPTELLKLN